MEASEGYHVLRLIEHNQKCYVSSEFTEGKSLIQYLKCEQRISREQLFRWIQEMAKQLQCIHKCRGNPCYQYVNPYSIIVTEDQELYFLDISAESNRDRLARMQKRDVREYFLPPEEAYYQTASVELDIYGLGRTIQYLLSISKPEPPLTRKEEIRFQKIISRCLNRHSKKSYSQVSELRKQIPIYCEVKTYLSKKKMLLLVTTVIVAGVASKEMLIHDREESITTDSEVAREEISIVQKDVNIESEIQSETESEQTELKKELGLLNFAVLKDYEKSRDYFLQLPEDELAVYMAKLAEFLERGEIYVRQEELLQVLEKLEDILPEGGEAEYERCMIEGYRLLEGEAAAREILRLGEHCMNYTVEEDVQKELCAYMAAACEVIEESEKAIGLYRDLLDMERETAVREEIYKKLILLLEEKGEMDKSYEMCRQGIEELKESKELRLLHMRMQCRDAAVGREICSQTIQQYLQEIPEIAEEQEFQKLMREYGITTEGGQVWVGR